MFIKPIHKTMYPTSEETAKRFNQEVKRQSEFAFTYHIIGTTKTYKYFPSSKRLQTIVCGIIVFQQTVENKGQALTFDEFLVATHEELRVVLKRNFGEN